MIEKISHFVPIVPHRRKAVGWIDVKLVDIDTNVDLSETLIFSSHSQAIF